MDFKDQIKILGERVVKLKDQVNTEEATKNAFIMPFINALGYDIFNPSEVVPEFVADVGIKQGEKIDYAIMKDGAPIILIECKWHGQPLNVHNASQLFRYFHTTKAKFSILSNGLEYRFYTDLVEPNKMDEKPFFVFNINEIKDNQVDELKKFHKAYFDFENIVNTASELKFTNELKTLISNEMANPNPEFVKYFAKQVYPGMVTQKVLDLFTNLTKKSFAQIINDLITERLKSALSKETEVQASDASESISEESKIVTTQEEMDSYYIIRAILSSVVKPARVHFRDAQTYFAVLLDDNNRKTICRFYLTEKRKQIGLFDEAKKETKYEINDLDEIHQFDSQLKKAIQYLESGRN
ncbi:restriction endonuclease [Emticicia sp. CRIBPO]|uniref:type I restriction endonuclease n=1 Tax=Emticicia sp. CRIBPO TaxID=2683258 RepID=UPI001412C586|nr:type I restriction endonuclease [Emticicia sp. CRIBPO]NBA88425.1 restriction endonuclease [Emticicia sp. CRIBPO]